MEYGYEHSRPVAGFVAWAHEWPVFSGASQEDVRLGLLAVQIGAALRSGRMSRQDIAAWIRGSP